MPSVYAFGSKFIALKDWKKILQFKNKETIVFNKIKTYL